METWKSALKLIKGVGKLTRFIPVLSWSICSIILGLASGYYLSARWEPNWFHLALLLSTGFIFQGIVAHSINDIWDLKSGTDLYSPGLLSGGSGVLTHNMLSQCQVIILFWIGLLLGTAIGIYFFTLYGWKVLMFLFIAFWSSIAYSLPPLRLSHIPFAGEWLAAWPAMVASTVGTSFIVTQGSISSLATVAGIIHATFSIGWLMQHHISDIEADRISVPKKETTVLWVSEKLGCEWVNVPAALYFTLAGIIGWWSGTHYHKAFYTSCIIAPLCIIQASRTNPLHIGSITNRELKMIALVCANSIIISMLLIWA